MFKNRSVVEIMVIIFTLVVSSALMFTGAMVAIVEIRDPTADTDTAVDVLFTAITVILGALLGLLAGKSEGMGDLGKKPDGQKDDVTPP